MTDTVVSQQAASTSGDGEYIYQTPASTGSSTNASSEANASAVSSPVAEADSDKPGKRPNRFSAMPGFGSLSKASGGRAAQGNAEQWRRSTVSVGEVR